MFDAVMVIALGGIFVVILGGIRIAYEAGIDKGWQEAGAWWDYMAKRDPQAFMEHISAHARGDVE